MLIVVSQTPRELGSIWEMGISIIIKTILWSTPLILQIQGFVRNTWSPADIEKLLECRCQCAVVIYCSALITTRVETVSYTTTHWRELTLTDIFLCKDILSACIAHKHLVADRYHFTYVCWHATLTCVLLLQLDDGTLSKVMLTALPISNTTVLGLVAFHHINWKDPFSLASFKEMTATWWTKSQCDVVQITCVVELKYKYSCSGQGSSSHSVTKILNISPLQNNQRLIWALQSQRFLYKTEGNTSF